ncbi:fatty acid desaturase [Shewanella marina]|uniref:fatty acid desaturase n=1 Tax=Shewanella marina TaxID=487319 RepID=UPI000470D9B7|nr:fatty acid desaturase [Shewanella marina]
MTKPPLIWTNVILFSITTLAAITLLPWYGYQYGFETATWISFGLLSVYSGLSITAGYHRLWSHKAFQAHPIVRLIFALGGALALQNSALHWCSDHRIHHKHVDDNDKDPYSAKRGFWYSHIGWMLRDYQGSRYGDYRNVRDLSQDPIVAWQHKHYLLLVIIMNIGLPLLLGMIFGQIWGMLLLAGLGRLVLVHHCTFFINSLAHIWGSQPYTQKNTARDNGLIALLTYGEGYHNFHHLFEYDYRNGIRWWQYDPTKWLINLLAWGGLASKLRTCPEENIAQARITAQLELLKQRLSQFHDNEQLIANLQKEYEHLKYLLVQYYQAKKALLDAKRKKLVDQQLLTTVTNLRAELIKQQKIWKNITAYYKSSHQS